MCGDDNQQRRELRAMSITRMRQRMMRTAGAWWISGQRSFARDRDGRDAKGSEAARDRQGRLFILPIIPLPFRRRSYAAP